MHDSISNYEIKAIGPSGELTHLYGQEKVFQDLDYSVTTPKRVLSGQPKRCVWVKNGHSSAITPRQVLKWDSGTDEVGKVVVPAGDDDKPCGVANEFMVSAGAAAGEGFFMVIEGPTQLISDGGSTLAVTDVVVTAASAKVNKQDANAATTDIMKQVQSRVGRPMETVTNVDGTTFRALVGPFPK
jgi:hypothetical protein